MNHFYFGKRTANVLLFRFLSAATLTLILVAAVLFWQQWRKDNEAVPTSPEVRKFSTYASEHEVTAMYPFGAVAIHDIETYPEIATLFFSGQLNQLRDGRVVAEALAEVRDGRQKATEFSDSHVHNTSYYIGNLLVTPTLTLYDLLLQTQRPHTTELLMMALADVRAGVSKIGSYYDAAPPSFYDDTITSAIYFVTPSFPSLTVSEVGIVLFVLAELDPKNARLYEQQLYQYAEHTWSSGGHFRLDIEYALKLASAYHQIIMQHPDYASALTQARAEWAKSAALSASGLSTTTSEFFVEDFPYQTNFSISSPENLGYTPMANAEELGGSIMLSLVDMRLPNPLVRPYEFSLGEGTLLPFAVEQSSRKHRELGSFSGFADYQAEDRYVFVTGEHKPVERRADLVLGATSIVLRDGDTLTPLTAPGEEDLVRSNPRVNSNETKVVFAEYPTKAATLPSQWEIRIAPTTPYGSVESTLITNGSQPDFVSDHEIIFIRGGEVLSFNLDSEFEQTLFLLPEVDSVVASDYVLRYEPHTETIVLAQNYTDRLAGEPQTIIYLYALNQEADTLKVSLDYKVRLTDSQVGDVELSSGGNYLALTLTSTAQERRPRLLIFDVISGIIKKDFDLSPFVTRLLEIDDWVIF